MESKSGKLIAIWGNPGCGKTTTAVRLAKMLATKNEVMIVFTNIVAPDLPVLLPQKKLLSMGGLWNNPNCTEETILKQCIPVTDHLAVLGYCSGENAYSYPNYVDETVFEIYQKLQSLADYILIDCVSYYSYNMLTTVALEKADMVIRIGEATLGSFSFYDSNLHQLADNRYNLENHVRVLGKVKSFQEKELARSRLGTTMEIPYSELMERALLEGDLFQRKSDKRFEEGMDRLRVRIEGEKYE